MRGGLFLGLGLAACSVDAPAALEPELVHLEAEAAQGVATVRQALAVPQIPFESLGQGERAVQAAVKALAALEADPALGSRQHLRATLLEARAYDDLNQALHPPAFSADLSAEEQAVLARALEDRARPARAGARSAFERALSVLCSAGLVEHPALLEILDGLSRYGASAPSPSRPCD